MLRRREDVGDRALLDDAALVHDGDPVGPPRDEPQVVRDDEQSGTPGLRRPQLFHHGDGDPGVERRRRFVGDQQRGGPDGRRGDEGPLSHPARQCPGEPAVGRDVRVEAHCGQGVAHGVHALGRTHRGVQAEAVGDLASDGAQRVQRAQGLLADVADP